MKVLLDTDTCIFALRGHERVLSRLLSHRRSDIAVSVITEAELRTGAAKSARPVATARAVDHFLRPLTVLDFGSKDAVIYARLRARLERDGSLIGPMDLLIAAQAVSRRLTLATGNEREFRRVSGLRIEDWAA